MEKTKKLGKNHSSLFGIVKRILIFAALVTLTTFALRPLQLIMQKQMEKIRNDFFAGFEEYSGLKVIYGSISPSIFGVLDIRDILVLREDASTLLSVSRLRLSFSLLTLIRGEVRNAFHSVRIDRPVLSFDFKKDADLLERLSSPQRRYSNGEDSSLNPEDLLPETFILRIWNGEWKGGFSAGEFTFQNVKLDASVDRKEISFQGRWNVQGSLNKDFSVFPTGGITGNSPLEGIMSGRISGEYSGDTREGSATVSIPSFYGENFELRPLSVLFFLSGSRLEARKAYDRSPAAFSFNYDFESEKLKGNFEGENFSPGDLISFTGSWAEYNPVLAFRISGSADIEMESSGALRYSLNFSGDMPEASPVGEASLAAKAAGDENGAAIDELEVISPYGGIAYRGTLAYSPVSPDGILSLAGFSLNGGEGISGDFYINTYGEEINLFAESFSSGGKDFSAFDSSIRREETGLTFVLSALRFSNIESYEDVRLGTIFLEGSIDNDPRQFWARASLDSFSSGDILSLLEPFSRDAAVFSPLRYGAEDLFVTTEVFFSTDYEHILYNAPHIVAAYEGMGNVLAQVSLSGTDRGFELNDGRISWPTGSADIYCSVDFSDFNDISFSLGTTYRELTYYFDGMILDQKNISLRGSYGIQVNFNAGTSGTYSGYAQGDNIPFPSEDNLGLGHFSFLLTGFYDSPSYWQINVDRFNISGLGTPSSVSAELRLTGTADQSGINIPNIFFDDGKGALLGNIRANWDRSYSFFDFGAEISSGSRAEYYNLDGNYGKEGLEVFLSGQGMQLSRFISQNIVTDGTLSLLWNSIYEFEAEAKLTNLVYNIRDNNTLYASLEAGINADTFVVRQLNLKYLELEASLPYFIVNRASSSAETEAVIGGAFYGKPVDLSLWGEASFASGGKADETDEDTPGETWLNLLSGFSSLNGSLTLETAGYGGVKADEPFTFSFSGERKKEGLAFDVNGGPRNMLRFRFNPEEAGNSFYAAFSAPFPVRGAISGTIDSETIDASASDLYVDLRALWNIVPRVDEIQFPGGIVTASVRVSGLLEDPEFFGTATGRSVEITVPQYLSEPIRAAPVIFSLTGPEMRFGPVDAVVGSGGGKASGLFTFNRWLPDVFNINIEVPEETPIPYAIDLSGVMAHGLTFGELVLSMEERAFFIDGELTANDTEISVASGDFGMLNIKKDRVRSTVANIKIYAGRRVEFFWPSVEFPILQAYPDMGTGITISTDSESESFSLTGDVELRSGELFYLERNFYIKEGTLYFNEDESEFNPNISARAEIRDQIESGPVTISMIIDNAPLREFTPRFIANPPLSQMEIYSLLGQNTAGEESAASQRNVATAAFADILTQFTVTRRLQRGVRDFLGLDMFSLRTQLLQNMVFRATEENSTTMVDAPYRFGNYFDNTTVFIGKYFGANIFGQALLSLKYDENQQDWGGVVLEPEFGLEMRNPLFDIRFSMLPLHPENWFVNDLSFSLVWRRSFR